MTEFVVDTVLAVDIGGTKLAAAVVSPEGRVLHRLQVPTPREGVWTALAGVCEDVLDGATADRVGVGCGGPMLWPGGVVQPLNIPEWREGFGLRDALADRFGPTRVHNDAVCVAVAEHWVGAGRGVSHLLGIVVSTGVGGGLVMGGRLVDGATGNAGHVGHVVVEPDGPECACGGRGCLEAIASGPAIARWAGASSGAEAAEAAARGDAAAVAAFQRAGHALGCAVASVAAVCDLELALVAGSVSRAGELLFAPARAALAVHARLGFLSGFRLEPAGLGTDAGLVGAAALWLAGERYWSAD
ncbi:MAG: glucokinase [Frankiales bacterium]|nr:glucokinase [Frankiales bacterium]